MKVKRRTAAIVLAAGSGKRMNGNTKKQYLQIQDKPVLYYSLQAFEESCIERVVLVVSPDETEYCHNEIIDKYHFHKISQIAEGGKERYHSVYNGLQCLQDCDYVLIHDAARPFLTQDMIERALQGACENGACVVGMPVKDTIKIADEMEFAINTPPRELLWGIQTPQAFSYAMIYEAYQKLFAHEEEMLLTDDAMVVEKVLGHKVKLIKGSYSNIKITTPEDLEMAQILVNRF